MLLGTANAAPKARISGILSELISFVQSHKETLPNSPQIIQSLHDVQTDIEVLSVDALEIAWSSISSELQKSIKRANQSEAAHPVSHHFSQIRSAISEFQKHPPVSFNEKRNSKRLSSEILVILSTIENQMSTNPARAKATLQTLKTKLGADFVSFFRQSQLDKFQKSKRKDEITKSIDSLLLVISTVPREILEIPPSVHEVPDLIAQLKPKKPHTARAATPPSPRGSKIPTRVSSPTRDDRRRSELGAVAHKMKATPRKTEPKAMTSILASRKSLTPGIQKKEVHTHRRSGSLTETPDDLHMFSSKLRRASSSNEIDFDTEKTAPKSPLWDREMDSETDMMMSALSRSHIMESRTHEFLEKAVRNCESGGKMLQECMRSIRRVEIRCQRFMANFGENEIVSRFLAKIGEAKMIFSEGKMEELETLFVSVEKVLESIDVRKLLKTNPDDEHLKSRVEIVRQSSNSHVETFLTNEIKRLENLTKQMKGFGEWEAERDQEAEKHKDLREKLNNLRQEFAQLTDARNTESDSELIAEIKQKHARALKLREQKRVAVENAAQMAKGWNESEQRLVGHYRLANQQLAKFMAARRKLVAENLPHVTVRGMEYTLVQLDQAIAQALDRESRVTKGFAKVSTARKKVVSDLTARK